MKYAISKGVFDILPFEDSLEDKWRSSYLWQFVEETIRTVTKAYNFQEIRTPLFESTDLFVRGVGESSDIVTKEMYTFKDKADRSITLRPEGTAAVMRAFLENHLDQKLKTCKFYYIGPMFRYERPQAGRYRQHHQFGVEAIGTSRPEQDVEVIDLLCEFYRRLGIQNLTVMLNSVGDVASRTSYKQALRSFLEKNVSELSEDSKVRFEKNVLRILDSKDPQDQKLLEKAPLILDFLTEEAKHHFETVKRLLTQLGIPYVINPKLVRGLDYYSDTVFEVTSTHLGAQNAIGAGGRYDDLSSSLGGPPLPSIGFAAGIERVLQTMLKQNNTLPVKPHPTLFLIPLGEEAFDFCMTLSSKLRHQNIATEVDWNCKKVSKSLEKASALNATYALVVGEEELASQTVKVKNLTNREVATVSLDNLPNFLLG